MADILLFTGQVHSGRTRFMEAMAAGLRTRGMEPHGFLSRGEGRVERTGYMLKDLEDESLLALAGREELPGWERQGRFYFNPEALMKGNRILEKAMDATAPVIIVDEVGPMELEGRGWAPALDRLVLLQEGIQLWMTRNRVLDRVRERWGIPLTNVYPAEQSRLEENLKKTESHA